MRAKVVQSVVWSAIQSWGSYAASLVIFFLLARLLKPSDFGVFALANAISTLLQILLNQGFAQAVIQRETLENEHLDVAFWTNMGIGLGLTLVTWVSASSVGAVLGQPMVGEMLQVLAVVFPIVALAKIQQAVLERQFNFKAIAIRALLATVLGGSTGIISALYGLGSWSLLIQLIVYEAVATATLWFASSWRPRFQFSQRHFQDLSSFGVNVLGANFLGYLNNHADDLLIGSFLGQQALGYYTIAYRILTVMTNLLVVTGQQVALPAFSKLKHDPEQFRQAFYRATQLTSLMAFPSFAGAAILAPQLIVVLFGESWIPSIPVLQVLAFVGAARSITYFKGSVFLALGQPVWKLRMTLLGTVLNLTGFMIAVRWGIVAVSLAHLVRAVILFPIGQWIVTRLIQTPLGTYLQQFRTPLASSGLMALTVATVRSGLGTEVALPVVVIGCVGAGVVSYGAAIWILDRPLFRELWELAQQVGSRPPSKSSQATVSGAKP